jgi:hypothetical protein
MRGRQPTHVLVVQHCVAVTESAALDVLSTQTHVHALTQQSTKRQRLSRSPAPSHQPQVSITSFISHVSTCNSPINALFAGDCRFAARQITGHQTRVELEVRRQIHEFGAHRTQRLCAQHSTAQFETSIT